MPRKRAKSSAAIRPPYDGLVGDIADLLAAARRASARAVNALMTATYWEIGRRIVEFEQGGAKRAEYGTELLGSLSRDLSRKCGPGFSRRNLQAMRQFYVAFPPARIRQTLSAKSISSHELAGATSSLNLVSSEIAQTVSAQFAGEESTAMACTLRELSRAFPLSWSHYFLLIQRSRSPGALEFYHTEALRGGWSVRQLARQIDSQFYERTALSRNKAGMLARGGKRSRPTR